MLTRLAPSPLACMRALGGPSGVRRLTVKPFSWRDAVSAPVSKPIIDPKALPEQVEVRVP